MRLSKNGNFLNSANQAPFLEFEEQKYVGTPENVISYTGKKNIIISDKRLPA